VALQAFQRDLESKDKRRITMESHLTNMNEMNTSLEDHILHFFRHSFGFQGNDRLLIYTDRHSDSNLADAMQQAAIKLGAVVRQAEISSDRSLEDSSEWLVREIQEFAPTKICELSGQYYYQTPVWRHGVEGGAQIYSLCGLGADGFIRCIG